MNVRDEENRPARLKENLLRQDVVKTVVVGIGLRNDCQIVQPGRGSHRPGGFERKACERLEAIGDARIACLGFKDRKGCVGPRQRALTFDLKHRCDRRAAFDSEADICDFIAGRHRIEMRRACNRKRDRGIYNRTYQTFRGNVDKKIFLSINRLRR